MQITGVHQHRTCSAVVLVQCIDFTSALQILQRQLAKFVEALLDIRRRDVAALFRPDWRARASIRLRKCNATRRLTYAAFTSARARLR